MSTKLTQKEFIKRSKIIHKNKYDYTVSNYVDYVTKIKIICPVHGIFDQTPAGHLKGNGCFKCKNDNRSKDHSLSQKEFIKRAKKRHGNKYNYSKCVYQHSFSDIIIICKKHGEFLQKAGNHLSGCGCNKCAREKVNKNKLLTLKEFIKRSNKIHHNKYKYTIVKYINISTKVKIICPVHGIFDQTPNNHLGGNGCSCCKSDKNGDTCRKSTRQFTKEANKIHAGKYNYNLVNYTNFRTSVKITCPIHGLFKQQPRHHLKGHGCPKCSKRISSVERIWLDKMGVPDKTSNRNVTLYLNKKPYYVDGLVKNTIYEFYGDYWHGNPQIYNQKDVNKISKKSFGQLYKRTIEREEELKKAGYRIITIWENDFKNN